MAVTGAESLRVEHFENGCRLPSQIISACQADSQKGVPALARLTCTWMISRRTRSLFSEMTVPVLMSH
jgi:hypothetical protein